MGVRVMERGPTPLDETAFAFFNYLPDEMVLYILGFLPPSILLQSETICKWFQAMAQDEWKKPTKTESPDRKDQELTEESQNPIEIKTELKIAYIRGKNLIQWEKLKEVDKRKAFKQIVSGGRPEFVQDLLDNDKGVLSETQIKAALCLAAKIGSIEKINRLLSNQGRNASQYMLTKMLDISCEQGHLHVVKFLLKKEKAKLLGSSLCFAASGSHLEIVNYLLAYKSKHPDGSFPRFTVVSIKKAIVEAKTEAKTEGKEKCLEIIKVLSAYLIKEYPSEARDKKNESNNIQQTIPMHCDSQNIAIFTSYTSSSRIHITIKGKKEGKSLDNIKKMVVKL